MQCPVCGNDNKDGTKFCTKCGHKFEKESEKNILNYNQLNQGKMKDSSVNNYLDNEEETEPKKGISTLKLTAVFVVVFLILGGAGIGALHFGLLDSSNGHYSRNLKGTSSNKSEKSKEAEGTTFDDWGIAPDEDTTEDFTYGLDTTTAATTENTQATTALNDNQNIADDDNKGMSGNKEVTLSGVDASNVPNYNNYLSPDNYAKLTVDSNFSFSYPVGFFCKVEQYNKNYTFSTSDNSDTLYISCESGSGDAVKDVKDAANKNASLINSKEEKHGVQVVSDKVKDGWAHCIIGGNYTEGQNGNGMYKIIVSNGSSIYTLDYEYGSSDTSTYYTAQNYMLDCMYRYCEHSGTTYKPRTWDDFLNDKMGEKKDGSNATVQNSTKSASKSSATKGYTDNNKKAFYGVWTQASKNLSEINKYKTDLEAKGLKCSVFLTSEWKNLNKEEWYAISVGVYSSKKEAKSNLKNVQANYSDAYVKYSGDYCG